MYLLYLLADIMGVAAALMKTRGGLVGYVLLQSIPIVIGIFYEDYYTTPFSIFAIILAIALIIVSNNHRVKQQRTSPFIKSRVEPATFVYQEEKQKLQSIETVAINEN